LVILGWPYLQEAKVVSISDDLFTYNISRLDIVTKQPHGDSELRDFIKSSENAESHYNKRYGVLIGNPEFMCTLHPLRGMYAC
jgi:5'-3' exoribonuclease 1